MMAQSASQHSRYKFKEQTDLQYLNHLIPHRIVIAELFVFRYYYDYSLCVRARVCFFIFLCLLLWSGEHRSECDGLVLYFHFRSDGLLLCCMHFAYTSSSATHIHKSNAHYTPIVSLC